MLSWSFYPERMNLQKVSAFSDLGITDGASIYCSSLIADRKLPVIDSVLQSNETGPSLPTRPCWLRYLSELVPFACVWPIIILYDPCKYLNVINTIWRTFLWIYHPLCAKVAPHVPFKPWTFGGNHELNHCSPCSEDALTVLLEEQVPGFRSTNNDTSISGWSVTWRRTCRWWRSHASWNF